RIGKDFVAPWTKYYSTTELKKIWTKIIYPNRKISNLHPKHQKILYGLRLYPEMAGYAVGYFLVKEYMTKKKLTDQELLSIPSEKIDRKSTRLNSCHVSISYAVFCLKKK